MEQKINFNEMNPYVRYVQYIEGTEEIYYLPWRILYDNFMIFMDSGSITLKFENKEIELQENDICIIPPFLKNTLEVKPGGHCGYYGCHFDFFYDDSEAFNEDVYIPENLGYVKADLAEMPIDEKLVHRNVYYPANIQFPEKMVMNEHARFRELFKRLLNQFQNRGFGSEMLMKSTFYEMLYMVISQIKENNQEENVDDHEIVYRYLQNLADDYDNHMDVASIALEYGMSPKKFRGVFKSAMQKTPKAYIIERKIQKAKELLETNRYHVGEVAYMLGYDDVFYFSKLFKRKVGISPRQYAESCKKE